MSGFASPNHTQTPNDLFDDMLPLMGEAELKIVLWAVRQTLGYHKGSDAISLSQFTSATGLSRQGAIDGIDKAIARGVLKRIAKGKRGVSVYSLVYSVDQSTEKTSTGQLSRPERAQTSQDSRHTKETENKENKKERTPSAPKKAATPVSVFNGVSKRDCLDIAHAWAENLSAPPIGAYSDRNLYTAAEIFNAGYRATQVAMFVREKKAAGWWKDKTLNLAKVAELLPEYVQNLKPRYSQNGTVDPGDDLIPDEWDATSGLRILPKAGVG